MATRSTQTKAAAVRKPALKGTPYVIVDFVFESGELWICVENIGEAPALKVQTRFSAPLNGLMGTRAIHNMALFRNIEFLAPRKAIRTLVDSSAAYFSRDEPHRITVRVSFQDGAKRRFQSTIHHDLSIYADIVYSARR